MMSGIICAKKINECLKENNFSESFLASYQKELKKEFSRLLTFSHIMAKMASSKYIFAAMVKLFKNRFQQKAPNFIKRKSY